jgi:hypothetical protein
MKKQKNQSSDEVQGVHEVNGYKIWCIFDQLVDVFQLKPHPANPNKHPDVQIALLQKILKEQGWRMPIVVSKRSGFIVSGHGRLEAAMRNGQDKVPVNFQEFQDEQMELIHLIADNRIHELSHMDKGEIKELLVELDSGLHDIEITGFTEKEIESMMTEEMPEIPQPEPTEDGISVSVKKCKHCGGLL